VHGKELNENLKHNEQMIFENRPNMCVKLNFYGMIVPTYITRNWEITYKYNNKKGKEMN